MVSYILRKTFPPFLVLFLLTAIAWRFISDFPGLLVLASILVYQMIWWFLHLIYIQGIKKEKNQIGVMMTANLLVKIFLAVLGGLMLHFAGFFEPRDNILWYAGLYFLYSFLINRHALQFFKEFGKESSAKRGQDSSGIGEIES